MSKFIKYVNKARELQKSTHNMPMRVPFLEVHKLNSKPPRIHGELKGNPRKVDLASEFNIKVGDLVQVLHGPDQGKHGVVLEIHHSRNKIIIEGCTMKKSFWNPNQGNGEPTLMTREGYMHITNVMLVDPILKKPTLVKRRSLMTGERVRICKLSGCALPDPIPPKQLLNAKKELEQSHVANSLKTLGSPIADKYAIKDRDDKKNYATIITLSKMMRNAGLPRFPMPNEIINNQDISFVPHKWSREFTPAAELARRLRENKTVQ